MKALIVPAFGVSFLILTHSGFNFADFQRAAIVPQGRCGAGPGASFIAVHFVDFCTKLVRIEACAYWLHTFSQIFKGNPKHAKSE
jgi:hypothetical protein